MHLCYLFSVGKKQEESNWHVAIVFVAVHHDDQLLLQQCKRAYIKHQQFMRAGGPTNRFDLEEPKE